MSSIFNKYSIRPRNLTEYTAFRGVTDFSNIGQFDQYEQGYQFLSVISLPKFMKKLAATDGGNDTFLRQMNASFKHMLMYEFRGLDGLPDLTAQTMQITDGINEVNMINRVSRDTAITVSAEYFEKRGSLITKWSEYYLTGIKDPMTEARTYHGLIEKGLMEPSFENEVFTLLYYATDSTMLRLERAILLCNAQLTKAETSMYAGNRENISNRPMTIEWTAFPIYGEMVDKAASVLLSNINGVGYYEDDNRKGVWSKVKESSYDSIKDFEKFGSGKHRDSYDFTYGIMNDESKGHAKNSILVDALKQADADNTRYLQEASNT